MAEKEIITLEEAQATAERFLNERLKSLKKISVIRVQLTSVERIIIYQVEGIVTIGGGFLSRSVERPFKVQVNANDAAIVGYET